MMISLLKFHIFEMSIFSNFEIEGLLIYLVNEQHPEQLTA